MKKIQVIAFSVFFFFSLFFFTSVQLLANGQLSPAASDCTEAPSYFHLKPNATNYQGDQKMYLRNFPKPNVTF